MTIRRAEITDIEEMVRLRMLFLSEVNGKAAPPEGFEEDQRRYLKWAMATGSFAGFLACENGKIVATGGVCFYSIVPNYSNPSGQVAYILNMFTLPEYRGRGLGQEIFARLIEEARARGVKKLALHATPAGRRVYEKFGFKGTDDEMVLKLG